MTKKCLGHRAKENTRQCLTSRKRPVRAVCEQRRVASGTENTVLRDGRDRCLQGPGSDKRTSMPHLGVQRPTHEQKYVAGGRNPQKLKLRPCETWVWARGPTLLTRKPPKTLLPPVGGPGQQQKIRLQQKSDSQSPGHTSWRSNKPKVAGGAWR